MSLKFLIIEKKTFPYERNMRSCVVQKNENQQDRLFQEIVNGNYPSRSLSKMNMSVLENFVLRLVEFTSVRVSAKPKSDLEMSNWWPWPRDVPVYKTERRKEFRENLKKVVIDCCDLFRGYKQKWLPQTLPWINDENFDFVQVKAEKRRAKDSLAVSPNKKRKKLLLSVKKQFTSEPYIRRSRYNPEILEPPKPQNQTEFLQYFKLSRNNNDIPESTQVPNSSKVIRLQNCPHVPFSSNVGQILMKKENCRVSNHVTYRKIEKIEWYINKESSRGTSNIQYDVSYVHSKNYNEHFFKFPKRQYHQIIGNRHFDNFVQKTYKPLKVSVTNEDLVKLKEESDKIKVKVNKLTKKQLKDHICKEATVVTEKKKIIKEPKIVLVNQNVRKITLRNKQITKNAKIVIEKTNFKKKLKVKDSTKRRQYHQTIGNRHFDNFVCKTCKPVKVVVKNEDLAKLKEESDKFKINVEVNKLTEKQLKDHFCKEATVVIERKKVIKEPKIVLVNQIYGKLL